MNRNKLLLTTILFGYSIQAQQSLYFNDKENFRYHLAENLYQTKVYNASQYEYSRQYFYNQNLGETRREAALFFDNVIGVILGQPYADKQLEAYMKSHPNSAFMEQANAPLADYYLRKKDFQKAIASLKKVNQAGLSSKENTKYVLKLGYAQFMLGDLQNATQTLNEAYRSADLSEKNDIAYMLGHLYYQQQDNAKAFEYFDMIKTLPKYKNLVKPYYVQLYFSQKDYDRAISEGQDLLADDQLTTEYRAEVNKIVGECYFMKKDYDSAYPYLKKYLDAKENPTMNDLYEMGFVTAQLQRYTEAVYYYSQILNEKSALAQNAYYQLGNAYLENHQKQEALSAYRSAYQMNYDAQIKELAGAKYAKLSYDIGNPYEAAPKVLQGFIDRYPRSSSNAEMKKLLAKSYLYSGDYKQTLEALKKMDKPTEETQKIEQEVTYMLGVEAYNKGNYQEAEAYFQKSLKYNFNKKIELKAKYWLGQSYYQQRDYDKAIATFESLKLQSGDYEEKEQLGYDLGYAYFKNKDFQKAQNYFKDYLTHPKEKFKKDAELRLADTYYANNQLNEAISIYDKADTADDYTLYQKALALGFKGDTEAKIATLKKLLAQYPKSEYKDEALYETASAYAANGQYKESNDYLSKVIKEAKDKNIIANAEIYKAQNLADENQNDKALSELKKLGLKYKNTAYASKIVQVARSIFAKNGDTAGYQSFAQNLGINLEQSDIDEINLTNAQQLYAQKEYAKAIPYYEKYLSENPNGKRGYQAQYELGESCYQNDDDTKALLVFQSVAATQNDYQEDAQVRLAQILIKKKESEKSLPYLLGTANSTDAKIRSFANQELMKYYAKKKDLDKAEAYANIVLSNSKNSESVREQAKIIKARNLMRKGQDKDTKTAYSALEKSSNPSVAAEALYAKAYYQNKVKAFKSSNETIFRLANNYSSEQYWGAKALVIMAKNYLALKDKYQASYTCDQIIANYKDFPDVVQEAQSVKKEIK